MRAGKGSKGDRLGIVDHATINYPPFRKNFYIEVPPACLLQPCMPQKHKRLRNTTFACVAICVADWAWLQAFRQEVNDALTA